MHRILVSGFRPFLGRFENPSQLILDEISKEYEPMITCLLPVEFENAYKTISEAVGVFKPEIVLMMGMAEKRPKIALEKVALNWNETTHQDEACFKPESGKIDDGKELALMTSFPVDDLNKFLKLRGHDVEISFSAGTFVCNNLYYKILRNHQGLKALFVHLPPREDLAISNQYLVVKDILEHSLSLLKKEN